MQKVAHDPSLMHVANHPIKNYYDRKEKLTASRTLYYSSDHPTRHLTEFETDMPRQSKGFQPTVDRGDKAASNDVEEEASECAERMK